MCKLSSLFFIYLIIFVWVLVPALAKSPNERKEWASHITHTHIYKYIYSQATLSSNGGPKADVISYYYFSLSLLPPLFKKKKKKKIPNPNKKEKQRQKTHTRQTDTDVHKEPKTHPQTQSIRHRFIFIAYLPCFSHESKRHLLLYDLSLSLLSFFRFCIFMSNVCLIIYCFKNWMIVVVGGFPFSLVRFHCS